MTLPVLPLLLNTYDEIGERLRRRLDGLTDQEYLWYPAPDGWSVLEQGGRCIPHPNQDVAPPSPVTTIAWRLWHIASDCLSSYTWRPNSAPAGGHTSTTRGPRW